TGLVSPLRPQICLNPVWLGGLLSTQRQTKPGGLIESCTQGVGTAPQTPGWLRSKNEPLWAPRQTPLGLRPKP
ncbi:MAG: hypothetical protein GY696_07585, partial [Gammaproteobacteria bacterium]|nr:hypothetical protein [Gammaproteobacteria bacterium]